MIDDVDEAIERYRAEVTAEAELSRADLDEIEDHMRALVADLREGGLPLAEAIAHARARLGEPRQLAREHARVRSPFGARLSRSRAWSAAALLALPVILYGHNSFRHGITTVDLAVWTALVGALAARRTWARAIVLGRVATSVVLETVHVVAGSHVDGVAENFGRERLVLLALFAAVLALLAPWHRRDLGRRGFALALLGPAYVAAMSSVIVWSNAPVSAVVADPVGSFALASVVVAYLGVLRGARWASLAAVLVVLAFAAGFGSHLASAPIAEIIELRVVTLGALGALGALAAVFVAWRSPPKDSHDLSSRTL
ncbi:MAG TPA: hypothetical protein VGG74_28510 [Kofleriaceae bacterium]|jgi:hypothetical protein